MIRSKLQHLRLIAAYVEGEGRRERCRILPGRRLYGAPPGHLRPALIGSWGAPCRYCQQHDQGQGDSRKIMVEASHDWRSNHPGFRVYCQCVLRLHRLQSRNAQSLQSRAESISCGSRQRHSGVPQLWSCIQHRAEAVEVVEALSELAGVGCQMMGLQLSRGSIDDQIELGDLLDERDLILAGEQIGLKLLELLLRCV